MTPPMPQPLLTVLFATRNGEKVLSRTLGGYCELEQSPIKWKLVIVDNGSFDETSNIVHSFAERLPLQILREPRAGKNRALNRGLQALEGQFVVITDDDAVPLPSFLESWARAMDTRTDYELFGGAIYPIFETAAPNWILQDAELAIMLFGTRDLPEGPVKADEI